MMPNEHKDSFLYSLLNICTLLVSSLFLVLILFPSVSFFIFCSDGLNLLFVKISIPDLEDRLP